MSALAALSPARTFIHRAIGRGEEIGGLRRYLGLRWRSKPGRPDPGPDDLDSARLDGDALWVAAAVFRPVSTRAIAGSVRKGTLWPFSD